MADPDPRADHPVSEPTGVVPAVGVRLADFLGGQPPLPVAYLLVVSGPARGTTLVVEEGPSVLGRSGEADLVLHDDTVSRRHARLSGDREELTLEDLGSSNGTTLNGNAIAGALGILDGDIVTFGSASVLVKRVV